MVAWPLSWRAAVCCLDCCVAGIADEKTIESPKCTTTTIALSRPIFLPSPRVPLIPPSQVPSHAVLGQRPLLHHPPHHIRQNSLHLCNLPLLPLSQPQRARLLRPHRPVLLLHHNHLRHSRPFSRSAPPQPPPPPPPPDACHLTPPQASRSSCRASRRTR